MRKNGRIDLRSSERVWPNKLAPRGSGFHREPFDAWWQRVSRLIPNIHPQVAEQWVHRHWQESPYGGIPLDDLATTLQRWTTIQILNAVHIHGWELNAVHDMGLFSEAHQLSSDGHPTVRPFQCHGTWDYPIIVFEPSPRLFVDGIRVPSAKCLLIEGHSRLRYLSAIALLGAPPDHISLRDEHEVFVASVSQLEKIDTEAR